ncbi:hypothetical protein [Streptomyces sp. WAC08241]|uniref:hypothetical protein n=1 Tax=Streptomyces sp. WAC08241 TaxID=2487421 RepID=UPI000F7A4151|nr:hypothetical protein [Streptomyces sp. WAC08241]RSS31159.1 hypothetical protein EF906_35140 [Streptomyces sp. WAC08241]
MKKIVKSAVLALLGGTGLGLAALVLSMMYAMSRDGSVSVPGLVDYVQTDAQLSMQPSAYFPAVVIALAVACFPVTYLALSRKRGDGHGAR